MYHKCMQVVNAANTLYSQPSNSIVQKSASVFKETWVENLALLTDAVSAITSTQDFVSVLGKFTSYCTTYSRLQLKINLPLRVS